MLRSLNKPQIRILACGVACIIVAAVLAAILAVVLTYLKGGFQ